MATYTDTEIFSSAISDCTIRTVMIQNVVTTTDDISLEGKQALPFRGRIEQYDNYYCYYRTGRDHLNHWNQHWFIATDFKSVWSLVRLDSGQLSFFVPADTNRTHVSLSIYCAGDKDLRGEFLISINNAIKEQGGGGQKWTDEERRQQFPNNKVVWRVFFDSHETITQHYANDKGQMVSLQTQSPKTGKRDCIIIVQDIDISNIVNPGRVNTFQIWADGDGDSSSLRVRYLDFAVQSVHTYDYQVVDSTTTVTDTTTHTTTTTSTTTFPATKDNINIHVLNNGVETLVPLYTDEDIEANPGKDIPGGYFLETASTGGNNYKAWMILNGSTDHPAFEKSGLCGWGYNILGYYLQKGKDYETYDTETYTEVVTIEVPIQVTIRADGW